MNLVQAKVKDISAPKRGLVRRIPFGLLSIFVFQFLCAVFFIWDIVASVFGFYALPLTWEMREILELGAAAGLSIGVFLGCYVLIRATRARSEAEEGLRRVSGLFMDLMYERFSEWRLTPAERDVALFAIKGLSLQQIAEMRATSEGTVKAQTNAIYRKAGVTGRSQLLSLFIEDLMSGDGAWQLHKDVESKPQAMIVQDQVA